MTAAVDQNLWATIAAGSVTAIVGFIIARLSKGLDARGAAEAALIGAGPAIIERQNQYIDTLRSDIQKLWDRERECRQDLDLCKSELDGALRRIAALERDHRTPRPN